MSDDINKAGKPDLKEPADAEQDPLGVIVDVSKFQDEIRQLKSSVETLEERFEWLAEQPIRVAHQTVTVDEIAELVLLQLIPLVQEEVSRRSETNE